eukprot:scaffold117716_cov44-Attheya_sp.AAC.1
MLPHPKRNAAERAEKEENKLIPLNTNQNQNPLSCRWRSLTQYTVRTWQHSRKDSKFFIVHA